MTSLQSNPKWEKNRKRNENKIPNYHSHSNGYGTHSVRVRACVCVCLRQQHSAHATRHTEYKNGNHSSGSAQSASPKFFKDISMDSDFITHQFFNEEKTITIVRNCSEYPCINE